MAIIPKAPGSTYAGPMPDSRAASYITYYTKSGWDRWKMASEGVAQAVAENKLTYQTAVDQYKLQLKDISAEKANLQKKISDIATLKAKAEVASNAARWKSLDSERFATYKAEASKAEKEAQIPSWGYSHGWSKQMGTGLGAAVRTAGGRDAGDEALDEVAGTPHESVSKSVASTSDVPTAVISIVEQYGRINSGGEDNTEYGSGIVQSLTFRQQASKLAQLSGGTLTELQAGEKIKAELAKNANGAVILGNIDRGNRAIEARAAGVGSRESESASKSGGATYGNITLPAMEKISDTPISLEAFDKAAGELDAKLKSITGLSPSVPVLEPIDLITTARRTYAEKFGDTPRGVSLALGGGVTGFYKNLAPFEITEGLKKTQKFFEMYIQDEISKARLAKTDFTVDDLNAATELGKAKARSVLFGNLRSPANAPLERTLGTAEALIRSTLSKEDREDPRRIGYKNVDAAQETGVPLSDSERARQADQEKEAERLRTPFSGDTAPAVEPATARIPVKPKSSAVTKPKVKTEAEKRAEEMALLAEPEPFGPVRPPPARPVPPGEIDYVPDSSRTPPLNIDFVTRGGFPAPPVPIGAQPPFSMLPPAGITPLGRLSGPPLGPAPLNVLPPASITPLGRILNPPMGPVPPPLIGPASPQRFPSALLVENLSPSDIPIGGRALTPFETSEMSGQLRFPPPGSMAPGAQRPGVNAPAAEIILEDYLDPKFVPKNKTDIDFIGPTEKPVSPGGKDIPIDVLGQVDKKAKSEAVVAATKRYIEEPRAAAKDITKDSLGKYVSSLYDTNKEKGAGARSVGELSSTLIREYSGDPRKQTKALELLTQLALLDAGSNRIRPV
jgi:hypothetical protein